LAFGINIAGPSVPVGVACSAWRHRFQRRTEFWVSATSLLAVLDGVGGFLFAGACSCYYLLKA
jgi:hypothetical protein